MHVRYYHHHNYSQMTFNSSYLLILLKITIALSYGTASALFGLLAIRFLLWYLWRKDFGVPEIFIATSALCANLYSL